MIVHVLKFNVRRCCYVDFNIILKSILRKKTELLSSYKSYRTTNGKIDPVEPVDLHKMVMVEYV